MGDDPHITLRIPSPDEFEMDSFYIPVPSAVIDSGIDVLQGFSVQWKQNEGSAMAHEVWDPLAVAAASALAGLMNAWAAHYHGDQARALVDQIACFCHFGDVVKRESLQGLRDHKGPGHTIFAPQTEH